MRREASLGVRSLFWEASNGVGILHVLDQTYGSISSKSCFPPLPYYRISDVLSRAENEDEEKGKLTRRFRDQGPKKWPLTLFLFRNLFPQPLPVLICLFLECIDGRVSLQIFEAVAKLKTECTFGKYSWFS